MGVASYNAIAIFYHVRAPPARAYTVLNFVSSPIVALQGSMQYR